MLFNFNQILIWLLSTSLGLPNHEVSFKNKSPAWNFVKQFWYFSLYNVLSPPSVQVTFIYFFIIWIINWRCIKIVFLFICIKKKVKKKLYNKNQIPSITIECLLFWLFSNSIKCWILLWCFVVIVLLLFVKKLLIHRQIFAKLTNDSQTNFV